MSSAPVVRPLTAKKRDGSPYFRRKVVEDEIASLLSLPPGELAKRFADGNEGSVSSEALIYFIRQLWSSPREATAPLAALLHRIYQRVKRSLGYLNQDVDDVAQEVAAKLSAWFSSRSERLDYYEVNFNDALRALIIEFIRGLRDDETSEAEDPWEVQAEQKRALGYQDDVLDMLTKEIHSFESEDPAKILEYNERLADAIALLALLALVRPNDRMAWFLHNVEGLPFEASDPEADSVSKIIGCTPKTARTRNERAQKAIEKMRTTSHD